MTLTLEHALPVVDAAGRCGIPVLLRGDSGIGKSKGLSRLAEVRGEHLEVLTANLYEPTDFGGLPAIIDGEVNLAAMPWVKRVLNAGKPSCVFIDEINTAPEPTQASLHRVLLERISGDVQLPESTRFVAAMNRVEASTGGWNLPAPIANRFLHLDIGVDATEWVSGMLSGWSTTPERITCLDPTDAQRRAALGTVTAFITARPDLLQDQPTDPTLAAGAWPSLRKWDWVAQILPMLPADGDLQVIAVEGLVGRSAADAFFTYTEEAALPPVTDVLADPASIDWANEPAEWTLGVLTAVVAAAGGDAATYAAAGNVLHVVEGAGMADLATGLLKPYLACAPAGATKDKALLAKFAPLLARAGKIS